VTPPLFLSFCSLIAGGSSSCYGYRTVTWGASKSCRHLRARGTFVCGRQQILACTSRSRRIVHTCVCVRVCVCVCVCVCACVCVNAYLCVGVSAYIYTHICIYVYVYISLGICFISCSPFLSLARSLSRSQALPRSLSVSFNSWQFRSECIGSVKMCM